jgi:hypothetical protein
MEYVTTDGSATAPVSPSPRRLMAPSTAAAIRRALEAYGDTGVRDSALRPAARMICDDARRSGLRVEQMLVALKSEWAAALEQCDVPLGTARNDLTSRFITLCIHAYYAAPSPETP